MTGEQLNESSVFDEHEPRNALSVKPAEILIHALGRYPATVIALTIVGVVAALVYSLSLPQHLQVHRDAVREDRRP